MNRDKCNKSLTTKGQANTEGLLVREGEQRMDVELFLDEYPRWEVNSPHCLLILHRMFQHAVEQGQKEAEL